MSGRMKRGWPTYVVQAAGTGFMVGVLWMASCLPPAGVEAKPPPGISTGFATSVKCYSGPVSYAYYEGWSHGTPTTSASGIYFTDSHGDDVVLTGDCVIVTRSDSAAVDGDGRSGL